MFEAYKVGVRLSLIDGVSAGLLAISRGFIALNKDADGAKASVSALERQIKSLKLTALAGGALMGAGGLGLALLKGPLDAARAYELAFTKFKTLNLGEAVNKQADQFARSANLMGVSGKQLMETLSESVGLFGSFDVARRLAPHIASLNTANSAIFGGKIDHIDEGATRSLMKFIDRRGGTHDETSFMRNLDLAQRLVTGSGGFVKFRDLDQFSQQGGTAFRGLSDTGVLNMALLLQEQGGARAGTSLMSMYQNLIAGRTPKKTMAMLQEFGLGTLAFQEHATVGGKSMKSLVMKDIKGGEMLQQDPATWFRTVFLPALATKGITSEGGILKATNDLLSNRNASGQASIMTTQLVQLLRDSSLAKGAMGYQQTVNAYANDPNSRFANLHARYNDLMRELGLAILPAVIRGLEGINGLLRLVADTAREWPVVTRVVMGLFAGISALAVAGGGLLLAKAGVGALALALGSAGTAGAAGVGLVGTLTAATLAVGALGVGLAAIVGLLTGKAIKEWLDKVTTDRTGMPNTFGGDLYDRMHGSATISGSGYTKKGRPDFVQPGYKRPYQERNGDIYLDGRKVGEIVSKHQGKDLARPSSGPRVFDGSMSPRTVGATGSW